MATTAILAGPGDFLPVVFVLIAIASGIANFIKERRAAAERVDANPRGGGWDGGGDVDQELQSEIDAFLQEVSPGSSESSNRQQGNTQQRRRRRRAKSDEEAERRRRVRARREHERKQQEADSKRKTLRQRHLETSELGEVSQRHVESSVEDRHLQTHIVDPRIDEKADLSMAAASVALATMLKQPGGVRNAILLGEVLGPPVARRPRKKQ